MNEFSIDFEQFNSIRGKLERLGLLTTARNENENNLYDNLNEIQSYLVCLDKGTAKKLNKFKKLERYNNFEISKYGKEFLSFFKS